MHTIIRAKRALVYISMPFLIAASCTKGDMPRPCRTTVYSFAVTGSFYPEQEIYRIGDTIFLRSVFDKILTDVVTNTKIDYSNAFNLGGNLTFSKLDTLQHLVIDSFSSFEVIPFNGTVTKIPQAEEKGLNTQYFESDNSYLLEIKIIFKKAGLYKLGITDLLSTGIKNKNCTNAGFEMTVTNANKHLDLLEYAIGYYPDALGEKGIYCFRVVE